MIENGRIVGGAKNLRWNESPAYVLNQIEMMGCPVRVSPTESGDLGGTVRVPALKVRGFTFTSVSDAV